MDLCKNLPLPSYPNLNERNIPHTAELTRIVNIVRTNEQILRDLELQLKEVRHNQGCLLQGVEESASEPNIATLETFSSLENVEKLLEKLEEHALQTAARLKPIQGAIHPIRRCPTDILHIIFEFVVMGNSHSWPKRLKCATKLSHICYRWREVALSNPRFWSRINISLEDDSQIIEALWTSAIDRIRMRPAIIRIKDISDEDEAWEKMQKCRLDLMPRIKTLKLSLNTNSAGVRLATDDFCQPTGLIETLHIKSSWMNSEDDDTDEDFENNSNSEGEGSGGYEDEEEEEEEEDEGDEGDTDEEDDIYTISVDPVQLLSRFSAFSRIELKGVDFRNLTAGVIFPNVSYLRVFASKNVPLNIMVQVFPNAENIAFIYVWFRKYSGKDISWYNVKEFMAHTPINIPWFNLKLPKVKELVLPKLVSHDNFLEFLRSHPSLQGVHTGKLIGGYSSITKSALHLKHLSLPASKARAALEFSGLITLRLFQSPSNDLELPPELLEDIIRKHFLSSRHVTKGLDEIEQPYTHRTLTVLVPINAPVALRWRLLPLLLLKDEKKYTEHLWTSKYTAYHYLWE